MNIITGYTGTSHITAAQDGAINMGIVGGNAILNVGSGMVPVIQSNTEVRIPDGVLVVQGRAAIIAAGAYDSLAIAAGTQGKSRKDLIVARYEMNGSGVESITLKVITGTPSSGTAVLPSYTAGNIYNGDVVAEFPLWCVNLSGTTISNVVAVSVVDDSNGFYRLNDSHKGDMVAQANEVGQLQFDMQNVEAAITGLSGIKIEKFALAAAAAKTVSLDNGSQVIVISDGAAATAKSMRIFNYTTTGSASVSNILDGSGCAITTSTGGMTITAGSTMTVYIVVLSGSITSIT